MKQRLARAAGAVADLVFPRSCIHCGGLPDHQDGGIAHLCTKCVEQLDFVNDPCCSTCGHPFYGELAGERMCPHCEGLAPAFRAGRTAVLCKRPARTLVHELKYRNGLYVLEDIGLIFRRSPAVLDFVRDATLIPVPLHPRKRRERGYNQSELIAQSLAAAAGGKTVVGHFLERQTDTVSQTTFDRRTRLTNLKNAFALLDKVAITAGHHYVLVDDVFTTGSTLNSCARVLRHAGCLNLDVITFGHG